MKAWEVVTINYFLMHGENFSQFLSVRSAYMVGRMIMDIFLATTLDSDRIEARKDVTSEFH